MRLINLMILFGFLGSVYGQDSNTEEVIGVSTASKSEMTGISDSVKTVSQPEATGISDSGKAASQEVVGTTDDNNILHPLPEKHSTANRREYQQVINKGRALTTTGIILHFIGLGTSTILTFSSNNALSNVSNTSSVVGIMTDVFQIAGPILTCSGASSVDRNLRQMDVDLPQSDTWREYAVGCGFIGTGLAATTVGAYMASQSSSNAVGGFVLVVGGTVLSIAGEVKWIRAMIHSAVYVRKASENVSKQYSFSFSPVIDSKGHYGLVAQVGF